MIDSARLRDRVVDDDRRTALARRLEGVAGREGGLDVRSPSSSRSS